MQTIQLFQNATNGQSFAADEIIFREGDIGNLMYVVVNGEVEIRLQDRLLDSIGPGGIIGEMALIDASPRSATAIAKTNCELMPINEKRFAFLIQQTPFFALQVMRIMADRMRQLHGQLELA